MSQRQGAEMKPGILEFIEQDAELWREVERFAQIPDDKMRQADWNRFHAAMRKADVAWRSRVARRRQKPPAGSAARSRGMP